MATYRYLERLFSTLVTSMDFAERALVKLRSYLSFSAISLCLSITSVQACEICESSRSANIFSLDGADPQWARQAQGKVLWGFIEHSGKFVIPPSFDQASAFSQGVCMVEKNNRWLKINRTGKIIPQNTDSMVSSQIEHANFCPKPFTKDIYFPADGKKIAAGSSDVHIEEFSEGLARFDILVSVNCRQDIDSFSHSSTETQLVTGYGFIDENGRVVIPPQYSNATPFNFGYAMVSKNGKQFLINHEGQIALTFDNVDVSDYCEGLIVASDGNTKRFIDATGKTAIAQHFADALPFSEGLAAVAVEVPEQEQLRLLTKKQEWTCGYLDKRGKLVIGAKFVGARPFHDGLAAVRVGLKWGYIDSTGAVKIKPKFDDAHSFSEGLAAVRMAYNWGYIDKRGAFVIKPKFRDYNAPISQRDHIEAKPFSEGMAIAHIPSENWKHIDRNGKVCFDFWVENSHDDINDFHEGLALRVRCDGKARPYDVAMINKRGDAVLIGGKGIDAPFSEGLAPVVRYNAENSNLPSRGFIDKNGNMVIAPGYFMVRSFKNGFAAVSNGDWNSRKWGYIDKTGLKISTISFDDAKDFSEGLAAVELGHKWGYINNSGKFVIAPRYQGAADFSDGLAMVKVGKKYGFINHNGKLVIPARYSGALPFSDGRAVVVFPNAKCTWFPSML